MMKPAGTPSSLGKNEFKCYHCRRVLLKKDGDWFNWGHMQVYLCHPCDKETKSNPKRA